MTKIAFTEMKHVTIPFAEFTAFALDYLKKNGMDLGDEPTIEHLVMPDTSPYIRRDESKLPALVTNVTLRVVTHQSDIL